MPIQAALTEKVPISVECDDRLLTLLGDDADLDLALLNVEDGIPPGSPWEKTFRFFR
jgi:hypothetical protein